MVQLNGKVAFVTGASSGIGYAASVELAKRGYKVYAGARRVDAMEPLKEYGVIPISFDVSSIASIIKARDLIELENDHLDILFNNAGVPSAAPAIEIADEDFIWCYEVNLYGPIRVTREFRNLIIKGKGILAYTSSTAQLLPFPFGGIYSSSKAALSAYISTLALEVKPFGVTVLDFVAGAIKTEIGLVKMPELAPDSLYIVNGRNLIKESRDTFHDKPLMDVKVYASKAVDDIESALKGSYFSNTNYYRLFRGSMATAVHLTTMLLPRSFVEYIIESSLNLRDGFGLIKKKHSSKSR